jgi:hypothetical protein
MARYKNIKGQVFGRLTVLEYIGTKYDSANWKCGCYCGNICTATIGDLNRKDRPKRSCGVCYLDHQYPDEWTAWRNMQARCYSKDSKDYPNYGGRGITVCERWRKDFLFFLEDMGVKESSSLTLDRINNAGNYEKENCRWVPRAIQNLNKRNTFKLLHQRK